MAHVQVPIRPEWATVARPGDTVIIGLADSDNVGKIAEGLREVFAATGIRFVVIDNVQQMLVTRPDGDAPAEGMREVTPDDVAG